MTNKLTLVPEVSRLDCRMMDLQGIFRHYCTLDRIDEDTVEIRGVTFPITRALVEDFIRVALDAGFRFIIFYRTNNAGRVVRRRKFNIITRKFVEKENM